MNNTGFPSSFEIDGRSVGSREKPLVIAEVAQAHDGSLGAAHAFIEVAANCGADAIKFQTHIAEAESTIDEKFRVPFSYEDKSRYEYWRRMQFDPEQWAGLVRHASQLGLLFLSSPFSLEAIDLLEKLDVPAWKVASGEITHIELIDAMAITGKPVLLSSGMSTFESIDNAIHRIKCMSKDPKVAVFQCTTKYPTPPQEIGINVLDLLVERYCVPVGLSDHSGDVIPSIAAMARGASLIEVHIALHKGMFGPDTASSLVPEQLSELCRARDVIHTMAMHPVDKTTVPSELSEAAILFGRSLALRRDLPKGTKLRISDLTLKKPGTGISYQEKQMVVGAVLAIDVCCNRLLQWSDLVERNK